MRWFGPFVSFMFYITQLLHAYYFYYQVGPALAAKYSNNSFVVAWLIFGWLIFVKVTYTYWYVSTSDPGSPSTIS